ncbi:MAG: hypothetical protein ISEC1_P0276 [Thiomicrorhabdus sp.]|nr:MAG: hypothetical protein ISEC1_P0276 [Thiomicrorhabdus sp.]
MKILILSVIRAILIASISMSMLASSQVYAQKPDSPHYSLRKYQHVKQFYHLTAEQAVKIGLEYNIPPAAILAIAGWESGYGEGYISQITGNIMSLGARKGEAELPPLTLPRNIAKDKIMIDIDRANQLPKGQVVWQKRPPSLKKDYRPQPYAGTNSNLLYFRENPSSLKQAYSSVMRDFSSSWISHKSKVPLFLQASREMEHLVASKGKAALLGCGVAKAFVKSIGGKPRSFNMRPAWIKHVVKIMDNAGLCALTQDIYKGKSFKQAWLR